MNNLRRFQGPVVTSEAKIFGKMLAWINVMIILILLLSWPV